MNVIPTAIPEVLLLEPRVFGDERGFFFESYNRAAFRDATGLDISFVQDNHSRSARGVLRGLHYQVTQQQGKLLRVVVGEIFDVAVDLRRASPTFGRWVGVRLSAANKCQLWIPPGFAHGFLALEDGTELLYKASDYYAPAHERCIVWNDPQIGIDWPRAGPPILSPKDAAGLSLAAAELPPYPLC
jgi:dTDP-4-dehydrorhamnose 3,5-epimerase